ncbi:MAG: hypothetical protein WCP87_05390 [Atribacterota bacterium]|nr:hypothetical protein [Candidatus Atribacteria bacterium]
MIKLMLEPVPYRSQETVYVYWEYHLENSSRLSFIPSPSLHTFLIQSIRRDLDAPSDMELICEEGRIKIWLPVVQYSEDLFQKIDAALRERLRILLEEILL